MRRLHSNLISIRYRKLTVDGSSEIKSLHHWPCALRRHSVNMSADQNTNCSCHICLLHTHWSFVLAETSVWSGAEAKPQHFRFATYFTNKFCLTLTFGWLYGLWNEIKFTKQIFGRLMMCRQCICVCESVDKFGCREASADYIRGKTQRLPTEGKYPVSTLPFSNPIAFSTSLCYVSTDSELTAWPGKAES